MKKLSDILGDDRVIILLLIILGLFLKVLIFGLVTTEESQDPYWVMTVAKNLMSGKGYTMWGQPHEVAQPVFPFTLVLFSIFTGDLHLSAQLISLILSLVSIPFIYLLWKKLGNREVAVMASLLLMFNPFVWEFSVRAMMDMAFFCFLSATLYFLYRSREDSRYLPLLFFFVMLGALTKQQGYVVVPVVVLSMLFWKRKLFFRKGYNLNYDGIGRVMRNRYVMLSLLILIIPMTVWFTRNYIELGSFIIPKYHEAKVASGYGPIGMAVFTSTYYTGIGPVFIITGLLGFLLTIRRWRTYLPFYLLFIFMSYLLMSFYETYPRYSIPLLIPAMGFTSILVCRALDYLSVKEARIRYGICAVILASVLVYSAPLTYQNTSDHGTKYDAVKEAAAWLNGNSDSGDGLLAGDGEPTYGFYTIRDVVSYDAANYFAGDIISKNPQLSGQPEMAYVIFLAQYKIKYFVPYDSRMPWFYSATKVFADDFRERTYAFTGANVTLTPVSRFEKSGQYVYLYNVTWEVV